jgi:hypothetical protein
MSTSTPLDRLRQHASLASLLASAATGCGASAHCLGPAPRRAVGDIAVLVTDESGTPLSGIEVTASHLVNPGPTDSFCCSHEPLGHAVTDRAGRAVLHHLPPACSELTVTPAAPGWRTVAVMNERGTTRCVLRRVDDPG